MQERCRVCAQALCGTQRRWLFHCGSRGSLQVALCHAVGRELLRDGRSEFVCSKCAFILERMFRCDTVVRRVVALSLETVHRLLLEKHRLRDSVCRKYHKNNPESEPGPGPRPESGPGPRQESESATDQASSLDSTYLQLVEEDLSELEWWAESEEDHTPWRRCRGCAALRVPDSDYEAVCGVPRGSGHRSTSCGPHVRCRGEERSEETRGAPETAAPAKSSDPRQEPQQEVPKAERLKGSRLPVRIRITSEMQEVRSQTQEVRSQTQNVMWAELEEMKDDWNDEYVQCGPFRFQERVLEEQSGKLSHCEVTSEQCLKELQDAQNQVRTLQTKIRISEDRNRMLQKRLGEMEVELRVVREEAQNQERNLQNLTDSLCSKDQEVTDLLRVVEDQNRALCSLKATGLAQVNAGDAAAIQSELFSLQLALDSAHRALKTRDRTEKDLRVALERVESDLRVALQRGRERLQHNQELQQVLDQTRTCLRDSEEQLRDQQNQVKRLNQDCNQIIGDLKERLRQEEEMIQVQEDLLNSTDQDSKIQKLRHVLQDRKQDLERVSLDRTRFLARSKELQELLRDKNQDLQTQKQVLLNNQETIRSLEVLVRGQSLQVEQLRDSLRKSTLKEDLVESKLNQSLSERDSVVQNLQEVLQERDQEVQELRSLLSHNPLLPDDIMQHLKLRLQLKDRLLQEVMSQRTRQIQDQQDQVQKLIQTIDQRDQYIQDYSPRFLELLKEQSDAMKELRMQLSSGLNPDQNPNHNPDQDLVQDQVWFLKEQLKKTQEHQHQIQQDLEDKNRLVKELVLELQRLRGRLHADCDQDRSLILGLESEDGAPVSGGVSFSL